MKLSDVAKGATVAMNMREFRRMAFFTPYPKQLEFFELGATKRERLLKAGNQLGKTEAGAFETTCHLTGEYPSWWKGRRWDRPTRGWIDGETGLLVRDVQQTKLCGKPGVVSAFGTGMIPRDAFADKPSLARGVTDAFDTIQVKHKSGGVSTATFKSYEQGREKHQGEPIDWAWCDEEPDMDLYSEILTRTTATKGMVYTTFTPLHGKTKLVIRFMDEQSDERACVNMTIEDALHFTPEERIKIIASYPAHEREARSFGTPLLGSGRIFTVMESTICEAMLEYIPPTWVKLWGIDFGIDHPFAAVLIAWDRDNDIIHVLHTFRMSDGLPLQHASAMKLVAAAVPVAWPHDGNNRDKGSGEALSKIYRSHQLAMLPTHSTFAEGGYSTEAIVKEMDERFTTGRLKFASHLSDMREEYREYHRKNGLIVHERDDLMSALQKAVMMRRFAKAVALGSKVGRRKGGQIAEGLDYDLWSV